MMTSRVRVSAPSRLHFGLLSFGHDDRRQFGGMGVALSSPRCQLELVPRKGFVTTGPDAARAAMFAERWAAHHRVDLNCEIKLQEAIPSHVGLGSGTQLALSVAAGLELFFERDDTSVVELAGTVGRGLRSAVGTYAFDQGGLIVERGKLPSEPLAELDCRVCLPDDWRFVLVRPADQEGLSGPPESNAFREIPPVPTATTERLESLIDTHLLPAAQLGDVADFGEHLYEYGMLAGECFATWQGGPFANESVQSLVNLLRGWGITGVGQSSWGPSVFALVASDAEAQQLARRLAERGEGTDEGTGRASAWQVDVTAVDNIGATGETEELSTSSDAGS